MASTNFSTIALIVFIVSTILLCVFRCIFPKIKNVLNIVFYVFTIVSQFIFIAYATKNMCKEFQWNTVIIYGLIPWVIVFGLMVILLKFLPGWKAPFSNTFGYLVVKIMGIGNVFSTLLKTPSNIANLSNNKLQTLLTKILGNKSLFINEFTPENFDTMMSNSKELFKSHINKTVFNRFKELVTIKDEVSMLIWYILTGGLATSIGQTGVNTEVCKNSPEFIENTNNAYMNKLKENSSKTTKKQQYFVRD